MSRQIETQILLNREINGEEIADISVDVIGDYAAPVHPLKNDPDDGPEASVNLAIIAKDAINGAGQVIFKIGERIALNKDEDDLACEALIREGQAA